MAWQFDRPDLGEGMVQAFRREKSGQESMQLNLKGLDFNTSYSVKSIDANDSEEILGSELMNKGLNISMEKSPQAKIFVYKAKR
jgi:alpha-galactosidase